MNTQQTSLNQGLEENQRTFQSEVRLSDIVIEERRRIAVEIMERFGAKAPLPINADRLLQFTNGVNSMKERIIDFAWELGARREMTTYD